MASYTTNLNLIKPADSDSYDVANDNGNMDKIDVWAGTTNTAIGTYSLGSVASLSAFETALNTYVSGLSQNDFRNIVVEFSVASSPFTNARYIGTVSKTTSARAQVTLHLHNGQQIMHGIQNSTTWDWKQYALKSDVFVSGEPTSVTSLTSGTAKTVSITSDGWYIVRAWNTTTSGACNAAAWNDSARTKIIGSSDSGVGTYVRAVCGPFPLKAGSSITVLANFTGTGDVCKLS